MKTTAEDYLAQASLLRLLAVLALVVAPHLLRLPPWLSAAAVALVVWRAVAALRQWPLPPTWAKILLAVAAFAGVSLAYGRVSGQHAGVALLVIMLALKLTEMRSRRDVLVVVSLCYFAMVTHFLFSQEFWAIGYLLGCAVLVTAVLVEANHPGGALSPRITLRHGGNLVLQALPLMVLLFVLFPRVPGPLWGLPTDAGAARTGLTDSMSPGDISRLTESDEVAFRVEFLGPAPPPEALYWRGPVLTRFNGSRWSALFRGDDYFSGYHNVPTDDAYEIAQIEVFGEPVRYAVTLQPHRQNWLLALDMPDPRQLPPNSMLTGYYQLMSMQLVRDLMRYEAVSYQRFRLAPTLSENARANALRLPGGRNPRSVALARQWRADGLDDEAIVVKALDYLRENHFVYTLHPPKLGTEMVDEFLFESRQGFCEHYAGAFTVLMRAAGVPARVVAGYQGGEKNPLGEHYVIRQYDAHAWTEVWLEGRGWARVDPTAVVAPSRIEMGLAAAMRPEELPGFLRRGEGLGMFWRAKLNVEVAWDLVHVAWDRFVLAYNPQLQLEFLSRFGLDDWSKMVLALTIGITVFMSAVGAVVMWRLRPAQPADAALASWRRLTRLLAGAGIVQQPAEGPADFVARVERERPDLAPRLRELLPLYLRARYLDQDAGAAQLELARAVKAWR